MSDLFEFESKWDNLNTLATGGHHTEWNTDCEALVTKIQSGSLKRLEKLEIWFQDLFDFYRSHVCPTCHHPRFKLPADKPFPTRKDVLAPIANNVDKLEAFSLKTVYIYSEQYSFSIQNTGAEEKLKIRSKNISVYFIVIPKW